LYRESAQLAQEPSVGLTTIGGDVPIASPPTPHRLRKGVGWPVRLEIALMTGPTVIVFVFFVILPIAIAAYYGFFSWQGYGPARDFVGLRNYVFIFEDGTFIDALQHNAAIVVLSLVIQGPAAVLLALLLNRKMRGQTLVRVLVFVPYVISEVVVGTGWSLMLQGDGAVNSLLTHYRAGLAAQQLALRTGYRHLDPAWRSSPGSTWDSPSSSSSPPSRTSRMNSRRRRRSTGRRTGKSNAASRCHCSDRPSASGPFYQ
jgi:hypothetical protein